MKVRYDAEITVIQSIAYLKLGTDIFRLDGMDSNKIIEFWNLITKEKVPEESGDKKAYDEFCDFLKNKGVLYDDDIWDAFFQQYAIKLNDVRSQMKKVTVLLLGNRDLCKEIKGYISKYFDCTCDRTKKNEYALIVGRKSHEKELLEANEYAYRHVNAYFPVLIEPFRVECGPMVLPGETPCLQCLYNRIGKNTLFPGERAAFKDLGIRNHTELFEPVYSIGFHMALIQLIKRWMLDKGIIIEQELQNLVWEYSFLDGTISQHNIVRDRDCPLCFPSRKPSDLNVWNAKV